MKLLARLVWLGVPLGIIGLLVDAVWLKLPLCFFGGVTLWASWAVGLNKRANDTLHVNEKSDKS